MTDGSESYGRASGLVVEDACISYGPVHAVRNVSLRVRPGECVGIVGSNGAGKSSLLAGISAIEPLQAGSVSLNGASLEGLATHVRARQGLVHVPENRHLFPHMTVIDTLRIVTRHARPGDWDLDRVFVLFRQLADRSHSLAGNLSGGERQMLAIARGLMLNPDVIMLDEPSAGLAPALIAEVIEAVGQLSDAGLGVLLVEQNVYAARRAASRLIVMESGVVTQRGGPEILGDDDELRQAYLGL